MVFNAKDPKVVDSLTVLAQGDESDQGPVRAVREPRQRRGQRRQPDGAGRRRQRQIWRHDLDSRKLGSGGKVDDSTGESSGIVDASEWFGPGSWLLTVQAHGTDQVAEVVPNPLGPSLPDLTIKREDGQLLRITIPGS